MKFEPQYFFEKMSFTELSIILENYMNRYRNEYEMNRLTNYVIAQSNSSKQLKLTDISTFDWDKQEVNNEKITQNIVNEMKEKGDDLIQKLMKNNIQI